MWDDNVCDDALHYSVTSTEGAHFIDTCNTFEQENGSGSTNFIFGQKKLVFFVDIFKSALEKYQDKTQKATEVWKELKAMFNEDGQDSDFQKSHPVEILNAKDDVERRLECL